MTRLFLLLAIGCLTGCGFARPSAVSHKTAQADPDPGWQVEPFALTERSGRTVTDKDLRGTVWVASFIFTRCTGPCPSVSSTVTRLQKELTGEPGVKFVTFTVDPTRDDLATLKEYATARGADPEKWLFLTGDETAIHKLMKESFKQAVGRKDGPDVKPGDEFAHSTRLMVVDRTGVVRGLYAGMPDERIPDSQADFDNNLARLKARVKDLLK
ncbi:SCO family protein [Gemmata sp.]|uniref:SCO family protein n=1 Tax=Gemmata sp. TaxID=1914242 RepID=UPI003F6E6A29